MALAFDAASSQVGALVSSLTWSHTCTGSELALLVGVGFSPDGCAAYSISGVTYDSVPMTSIGSVGDPSGDCMSVQQWKLSAPSSGAHNVVVTFTGNVYAVAGAASFTGASQDTGTLTGTQATASDMTATTSSITVNVTSAAGEIVFDTAMAGGDGGALTVNGSQDQRFLRGQSHGDAAGIPNIGGSTEAGAASVTMSWVISGNDVWLTAGVAVKGPADSPNLHPGEGVLVIAGAAPTVQLSEIGTLAGELVIAGYAPTFVNSGLVGITAGEGVLVVASSVPIPALGYDGTASVSLPLKTISAAGTQEPYALIDLLAPTLEAAGLTGEVGTADTSLIVKSISATGLTGTLGTADADLPLKTIDARGLDSLEDTLPVKTIEAEGLTGVVADADITLPAKTLSAEGVAGIIADVDSALPAKTLSAEGSAEIVHSATVTLPMLRVSATGFVGTVGTAIATLPAKTISAAGYVEITATGAATLPLLQIAASGYGALPTTYRTWALNTKNRALTEYTNLAFNSFALFKGAVLAASDSGIFVMGTQATDAGTVIAATVRDGAMDYGSSFLKRIPRIYVAGEQDGDVVFRTICTESGTRSYLLPFNGAGLRSRRVPVGKGPKSRYWSWEIANQAGAGFSYSSVAVYPEELRRRVV